MVKYTNINEEKHTLQKNDDKGLTKQRFDEVEIDE